MHSITRALKTFFTVALFAVLGTILTADTANAQWFSSAFIRNLEVRDSAEVKGPLKINTGAYLVYSGATTASIDSFTTTAVVDTVALTGVDATDLVFAQPHYPAWSATKDTGSSQYDAIAIADNIVVRRTKLSAGSTLKSAGIYQYFIVRKP